MLCMIRWLILSGRWWLLVLIFFSGLSFHFTLWTFIYLFHLFCTEQSWLEVSAKLFALFFLFCWQGTILLFPSPTFSPVVILSQCDFRIYVFMILARCYRHFQLYKANFQKTFLFNRFKKKVQKASLGYRGIYVFPLRLPSKCRCSPLGNKVGFCCFTSWTNLELYVLQLEN